jgi:mono/diheme cytochrome c family protein
MRFRIVVLGISILASAPISADPASTQGRAFRVLDQGSGWTPDAQGLFYNQDQGSQLIPLSWLSALKQADGMPFTDGALARYGYIPAPTNTSGLPIGFTVATTQKGPIVGMTCAACHTREIAVEDVTYRIDGGPAFADFQSFIVDLDRAVLRVLADSDGFRRFAKVVLGASSAEKDALASLHEDLALWSLRFHAIVAGSVPAGRPWGPARLDAIAMIYNRLNGLDLGPPPTYVLPGNMAVGDAPARYPFLWNAGRQDHTQWGGWAANGNDGLALARNLGQVFGVFAMFHPGPKRATDVLDRDYLGSNSANIAGLAQVEGALSRLGPPVWPFAVDAALAARGREVFDRSSVAGGCVECHGIRDGEPRPPNLHTWRTVTSDVGTDVRQWQVVLRSAKSGTLEGATVPGVVGPLGSTDLSLNILKAAVTGTLVAIQSAQAAAQAQTTTAGKQAPSGAAPARALMRMPAPQMEATMHVDAMAAPGPTPSRDSPAPPAPAYEARVLQGVWSAAPYLHNGSVPSLAELLKPAPQRTKSFPVGPAYDIHDVGLAASQAAGTFTMVTTGCEDRASGNSNCGHEYGTSLPDADKRALLEYLKTL